MKTSLKDEKAFFLHYVSGFLTEDHAHLKENITLKRNHCLRVMQHALKIATSLQFNKNERELAGILGLYHDIGRFKQYRDYHTFSDKDSVYHGDLGIDVLNDLNRFDRFTPTEKNILITSIHNHGIAKIENHVSGKELIYSKLIRDADKMDIFFIVDAYYKEMLTGKRNIALELGLRNEDKITSKVFDDFLNEHIILKTDMQYINDFKLLQIAWIYDLNFPFTRQYIKEKPYLSNIVSQITDTKKQTLIQEKVNRYLNAKTT